VNDSHKLNIKQRGDDSKRESDRNIKGTHVEKKNAGRER
jgi:hypothetical protein